MIPETPTIRYYNNDPDSLLMHAHTYGNHSYHVLTSGRAKVPDPADLVVLGGHTVQHEGITPTGLQVFARTGEYAGLTHLTVRRHSPSNVRLRDGYSGKETPAAEHYVMRMDSDEGANMAYAVARAIHASVPQHVTVTAIGDKRVTSGTLFRKGSTYDQSDSNHSYEVAFQRRRAERHMPAAFCEPHMRLPSSGPYVQEYFGNIMKKTPSEQAMAKRAKEIEDNTPTFSEQEAEMRRSYD